MKKKLVSAILIIAMVFAFFAAPVLPVAGNEAQEPVCPFAEKIQAAFDTVFLPIVPAMYSDGDDGDELSLLFYGLLAPVHEVIDNMVYTMDLLPDERIIMNDIVVHHFFENITLEIHSPYEDFIVADLSFTTTDEPSLITPFSTLPFPTPLNRTQHITRTHYYLHARIGSTHANMRFFVREDRAAFVDRAVNFWYVSYLPQIFITLDSYNTHINNNGRTIPLQPNTSFVMGYYLVIRNSQGDIVRTPRTLIYFPPAWNQRP